MNPVKSTIKKLLVANATKNYNKLVESKKVDYNSWILALEKADEETQKPFSIDNNCQTIDFTGGDDESCKNVNDGKLAEKASLCKPKSKNNSDCNHADVNLDTQYLVVSLSDFANSCDFIRKNENKNTNVILKLFSGEISNFAISEIHNCFEKNKNQIVIYSDEDKLQKDGIRVEPWFKPDWAPDDFLSYFYFGSLIAIRGDVIKELNLKAPTNLDELYHYLYELLLLKGGFDKHNYKKGGDSSIVGHIPKVLYHTTEKAGYEYIKDMHLEGALRERVNDLSVSVIIPSKDHPDVLFRCIDSFIDITKTAIKYEFVIVDNGSSEENRGLIESIIASYNTTHPLISFKYLYKKEEFNFSHMCNTGAKNASARYLLFLNDDMEILEPDWLDKLCEKTILPYVGAVGAKLIYPPTIKPEGDIIQHAGITNLKIGPAHKLQFESDKVDHYYGRNRYCHDMLGVTGACILVDKDIFNEVGGFDETLAVAFNDVDLCFKIFEAGYYNVERNDVRLFHHESLSRGNDSDSEKKMQRLAKEKDYLYEKHQDIYGKDPFYNINLTTDMLETEYAPKYHYEVKLDGKWSEIRDITDVINGAKQDPCVRIGMESAMDIYKWKYGVPVSKGKVAPGPDDTGFYFQGYTFVIGSNNACYERTLLLRNRETGRVYGMDTSYELRPDIKGNLSDQVNVDLTGYTAKIKADAVPKGDYQFGMYMKDKTSSLRLYNWSNWTLEV